MNKLTNFLYKITRNYAKNIFTGNLGKVVEDDEKITCYVKKSKVRKKDYRYTIACFGIGEKQKKVAEVYKLNKPICYVIENIELKKHKVYIFGYNNCEVVIKNCSFEFDPCIRVDGKCTLDNTNIVVFSKLSIGSNELIIKNMDSKQIRVIGNESDIEFGANNRIDIIDSNIGSQKKNINVSFLATNELNIVNSNIIGKEVECESSIINVDDKSSLIATDKVTLKTDDFDPVNINSPIIVLNGEEIVNKNKSVVLKKITEPLEIKRFELINLLRKVKTECENINSDKVLECQEELKVKPISKVLKR